MIAPEASPISRPTRASDLWRKAARDGSASRLRTAS